MGAFALVYSPKKETPGDPGVFSEAMKRLQHRGPDGSNTLALEGISMGSWQFYVTPEENGETQPLTLEQTPYYILFDGRIDNRPEVISQLNIAAEEAARISDAALALKAYALQGETCFQHFVGEFALVIYDKNKHELTCVRDHLGDRALFYTAHEHQVVIASEPWAVAAAYKSQPSLNERAIAHYFAITAPEDGQTFFNNIYELLPAHILKFTPNGKTQRQYWQIDFEKQIRYKTDEEYAEVFLHLLEESVKSQMRASTPVGVLMSGGLDSTSVASLVARLIAPKPLTTFSYVFDSFPECDERAYINTVKEKYNLRSVQIPCDDLPPYCDMETHTPNPNEPLENPYRTVHERTAAEMRQAGLRVILNGAFGDHLYAADREWLADLLAEGFAKRAWQETKKYIREYGIRSFFKARIPQRAARRLVDSIPYGRHLYRKSRKPRWMTPYAHSLLPDIVRQDPKKERNGLSAGIQASTHHSHYFFKSTKLGFELRSPYRNRRLIEFTLALPAYQIYQNGFHKYILRNALQGILPEKIASRIKPTSLLPFFQSGAARQNNILRQYVYGKNPSWSKFVKAEWLQSRWNKTITPEQDGPEALILWLAISYQKWQDFFSNHSF